MPYQPRHQSEAHTEIASVWCTSANQEAGKTPVFPEFGRVRASLEPTRVAVNE